MTKCSIFGAHSLSQKPQLQTSQQPSSHMTSPPSLDTTCLRAKPSSSFQAVLSATDCDWTPDHPPPAYLPSRLNAAPTREFTGPSSKLVREPQIRRPPQTVHCSWLCRPASGNYPVVPTLPILCWDPEGRQYPKQDAGDAVQSSANPRHDGSASARSPE